MPIAVGTSDDIVSLLAPRPHRHDNALLHPGRDYRGIKLGDWLFYPTVIAGAAYDDNIVYRANKPIAAGSFRLGTNLLFERDIGMHKTQISVDGDARLFPSEQRASTFNGSIGVAHAWEVQRDFQITARAEFQQRTSPVGAGNVFSAGQLIPLIAPQSFNRLYGVIAMRKDFDRLFVGVRSRRPRPPMRRSIRRLALSSRASVTIG